MQININLKQRTSNEKLSYPITNDLGFNYSTYFNYQQVYSINLLIVTPIIKCSVQATKSKPILIYYGVDSTSKSLQILHGRTSRRIGREPYFINKSSI